MLRDPFLGNRRWWYSGLAMALLLKHSELLIPVTAVYLYWEMLSIHHNSTADSSSSFSFSSRFRSVDFSALGNQFHF